MNKLKARIDAFNRLIVDAKATGVWGSIEAACIMAGWSNVAGALTPLKGAAPSNNGFGDSDLDAGIGLAGDGSSKNVATGRPQNADLQNSKHLSVYAASPAGADLEYYIGSSGSNWSGIQARLNGAAVQYANNSATYSPPITFSAGFLANNRSSPDGFSVRSGGIESPFEALSGTPPTDSVYVFDRLNVNKPSSTTLSWYSIGSSVDLAALDAVVSQLAADLRAIDEDGFDPLATDYIRRVEAADGAYLETGVKTAINDFIVGCRKDGILDALKASCIMCGARTISGALVPLAGDAPTPYNLTNFDYARTTGIKGDGSTTYLDSGRANDADGQDDMHLACYISTLPTLGITCSIGNYSASSASGTLLSVETGSKFGTRINSTAIDASVVMATGLCAASRQVPAEYQKRTGGVSSVVPAASTSPTSITHAVFALNGDSSVFGPFKSDARLAFYSIGSAISDLAALDNRVSTLISSISTALS